MTESGGERQESLSKRDLFLGLVQSFQHAAMQQMGKIMNPFTQKIERDLPHAKLSIDMLEMIQERTAGNLTGEEARFLQHVLTELRLNYVAETEHPDTGHPESEASPAPEPERPGGGAAPAPEPERPGGGAAPAPEP